MCNTTEAMNHQTIDQVNIQTEQTEKNQNQVNIQTEQTEKNQNNENLLNFTEKPTKSELIKTVDRLNSEPEETNSSREPSRDQETRF